MQHAGSQQIENAAKETTVQSLNRLATERIVTLEGFCNRLENFADRLEPQPRPTSAQGEKTPPISGDLQGLNQRLMQIGERLDWLGTICNRLDRIA